MNQSSGMSNSWPSRDSVPNRISNSHSFDSSFDIVDANNVRASQDGSR
jgi:hypothetical protein